MHHHTAIIDPKAKINEGVQIGPYSIIGADVEIGSGTVIESHVIVKGPTKMGKNNRILQFSSIGDGSPDKKYKDEPTQLIIGDENIIREGVTIHRGTIQEKGITSIGNRNLMMAYSHIAHDCEIEDDVAEVEGEIMFYYKEDEEHEEDDHRNCKDTGVNKASIGL